MLDILHAVDVSVDIHVAIARVDGADKLGRSSHFDTRRRIDGARFIRINILQNTSVVHFQEVDRLTGVGVYHRPNAAPVTENLSGEGIFHFEIAMGKESQRTLYPRFNSKLGVSHRHLSHFNDQSRQYPRTMNRIEIVHSEVSLVGMEVGRIEQMVA